LVPERCLQELEESVERVGDLYLGICAAAREESFHPQGALYPLVQWFPVGGRCQNVALDSLTTRFLHILACRVFQQAHDLLPEDQLVAALSAEELLFGVLKGRFEGLLSLVAFEVLEHRSQTVLDLCLQFVADDALTDLAGDFAYGLQGRDQE